MGLLLAAGLAACTGGRSALNESADLYQEPTDSATPASTATPAPTTSPTSGACKGGKPCPSGKPGKAGKPGKPDSAGQPPDEGDGGDEGDEGDEGAQAGCDLPVPPQSPGACTLVGGVWDITLDTWNDAAPMSLSFDDTGHFVQGAANADVCEQPLHQGVYTLQGATFRVVSVQGAGPCVAQFGADYSIAFNDDCSEATLKMLTDGCTGGALLQHGGHMKRR